MYGARQSVVRSVNVVLISTYELGCQPFGLASPAAWLRQVGATVTCLDLAVQRLEERAVASAGLVALYVPDAHGDSGSPHSLYRASAR